jgi:glucose 1-dehydrogenase
MDVSGKTALVTGAGRGIGKGCALELARCGADLIVNDRPGSPDLQGTVDEIRALGRKCKAVEGDVFTRPGCEQVVAAVLSAVERVDIFVSNPAAGTRQTFLEMDPQEFERTVQATLTGGFHMSQLVARHMVERGGGGKIVFISSVQAERPYTLSCAYGPAKAGLNHLMQSIAVELSLQVNMLHSLKTQFQQKASDCRGGVWGSHPKLAVPSHFWLPAMQTTSVVLSLRLMACTDSRTASTNFEHAFR